MTVRSTTFVVFFGTMLSLGLLAEMRNDVAEALLSVDVGLDIVDVAIGPPPVDPITVLGYSNSPPGADDDYAQTEMDLPIMIDVIANDSDPDGDELFVSDIYIWPENGDVEINDEHTITYIPFDGFVGTDTFDYEVSDGNGGTDTSLVTIDVFEAVPTNRSPGADDDYAQTEMDLPIMIDVIANDSDPDGDELFVSDIYIWPENGDVEINDEHTITYIPFDGFVGTDTFDYEVSDGNGGTDTALVTVDVFETSTGGQTVTLQIISSDLTKSRFTGQWVELWQNDEIVQENFTPFSTTIEPDIQYEVFIYDDPAESRFFDHWADGSTSPRRTISISVDTAFTAFFRNVQTPNSLPDANDDVAQTDKNLPVNILVLSNDSDPDGDSLDVSSISQLPHNGSVMINPDDAITYIPFDDFAGTDAFEYEVSDGNGGTDTALVTVDVIETTPQVLSITKTRSGLVAFDPLNNETKTKQQLESEQGFWHYNGSAFSYFNPPAPTDLFQDSEGLHLGVKSPTKGNYAGYFAVTNRTDASLFHAVITTPVRTISDEFFQNGLYVQTWDGRINYVTCVSITSTTGTTWHMVRTTGNTTQATLFETLWSDLTPNQPLTRDCTIVTNGNNYLKLYLDGAKVYENSTLNLQMPGPFLYFLEPQNSHTEMLYGIYRDYYATKNEFIQIVDNPPDAKLVSLVDANGDTIANSHVDATGNATVDVGSLHFPVVANIKVLDAIGNEIASTPTTQNIYGGDVFSIDNG